MSSVLGKMTAEFGLNTAPSKRRLQGGDGHSESRVQSSGLKARRPGSHGSCREQAGVPAPSPHRARPRQLSGTRFKTSWKSISIVDDTGFMQLSEDGSDVFRGGGGEVDS